MFRGDKMQTRTILIFSALAILTAGPGLSGLPAFPAELRPGEMAVRKVPWASA